MPDLHPTLELLTAFGLGRTSDAESLEVENHLADCEECRKRLEEIPNDSLVDLLQTPASDTDPGTQAVAADTDSSFLSKNSLPPLYKKVAEILGDKKEPPRPAPAVPRAPTKSPTVVPREAPKFTYPRELEDHPRYEMLAPLGAGGMGTVYKAQHRLMERTVAVKIVNPILVTKPGAVQRFTREVKAAAQLVHPNIVTAFDAERIGDLLLLVMEYVDGKTLADVLAAGELPVEKACEYVRQTAIGLQYALERGMVHRDINPHNLMLTPRGEVKILDFGLARFVSEEGHAGGSTEQGALMGSPDYMAPEQGRDAHAADERADIYSMGCTLYHLLAGQTPFIETSLLGKLEAHRDKKAIPIDRVRLGIPPELTKVLEKMMAKDPAQRFRTPAEVATALQPFTHGQPAPRAAAVPTMLAPAPEPGGRRSGVLWGAIVALLLLVGGGVFLSQFVFRVETPHGTLTIDTDNPDVKVVVSSGGKVVGVVFPNKELSLKVGEYTLELKGPDGFVLKTNHVEIKDGNDRKTVTIDFVPQNVAVKTPAVPIVPRPPPLDEWRKGRTRLTVAQTGPADYRTIAEALKAAKAGEYVYVLDKGPYRETLALLEPKEDIGLVSDVGTRIEPERWYEWGVHPGTKDKKIYLGAFFANMKGFRLSGFEVAMPALPADAEYANVIELSSVGDASVESCRVRFRLDIHGDLPADSADEFTRITALVLRCFGGKGRFLVENNLFDGLVELGGDQPATATVQRNWIRVRNRNAVLLPFDPLSDVLVTHNVIQGGNGVILRGRGPESDARGKCLIANNVLEGHTPVWGFPVSMFPEDQRAERLSLGRNVQIQNNIVRSAKNAGFEFDRNDQKIALEAWKLGHNCFASELKVTPGNLPPLPLHATDLIVAQPFLSEDMKSADYLRIPADSRQSKAGAAGELPPYLGAFPPGPAPKEGDWFTRMLSDAASRATPTPNKERRLTVDLNKVKPLRQDDFDDPNSGWAKGTITPPGRTLEADYDQGKYYMSTPASADGFMSWPPWGNHRNVAVEAIGRLASPAGDHWGLSLEWDKDRQRTIVVFIFKNGDCEVRFHGDGWPTPRTVSRPASLKKADEFNHVLAVMRDASLQIYINSVALGDPIELNQSMSPFVIGLAAGGQKGGRAEFERVSIWSADEIPRIDVSDIVSKAQVAFDKNDRDKVIAFCDDALRRDPDNAKARWLRGVTLANLGQVDRAIPDLSIVLERDPKDTAARVGRAFCFLNTNKLNECIDDATVALSLSPGHNGALANRATAYALLGRLDKAILDHDEAARVHAKANDPGLATVLYHRGQLHRKRGNEALAKADTEKALALNPALKGARGIADLLEKCIPQPQPLAEWLQGRKVITVSQNGKADFKKIGDALDAVKSGQVVKILDKGPYREALSKDLPQNVGIISDVGTRIEWDKWNDFGPRPGPPKLSQDVGIHLRCPRDIRLRGLEFFGGESKADFTILMSVIADGDLVVESCGAAVAGKPNARIEFWSRTRHNGNLWLRDNRFECHTLVNAPGSAVVIERSLFRDTKQSGILIFPQAPPREFVCRNCVVQSNSGIVLINHADGSVTESWANTSVLIANNMIEAAVYPIQIQTAKNGKSPWYPTNVRIHNNIISGGRDNRGITLKNSTLNAVKDGWKVSHNCYLGEPGGAGEWMSFPRQPSDIVNPQPFLSADPKDDNYLRIAADSPLATKGVGGPLPAFIGPLPPGPAPNNGDWFRRQRVIAPPAVRSPRELLALALAAVARNDDKEAIAGCDEILKQDPRNVDALWMRGQCYLHLARWQESLRDLDAVLAIDPNSEARSNRVHVYWRLGRWDDCIADADILVNRNSPSTSGVLQNRVTAYIRKGRLDLALGDYDRLMKLEPQVAQWRLFRGFVRERLGDVKEGVSDLRAAIAADPKLKAARSPLPPFAWPEDSVRGNRIPAPDFSKAKNLYRDDFVDAKEAAPKKQQALTHGIEKGCYFIHHSAPGWPSLPLVPGRHDEVICQVDGRVVDDPTCEWVVALIAAEHKQSLKVCLNDQGRVRVSIDDHGVGDRIRPLFIDRHPAIRPKSQFNTVTVIRRLQYVEIYVNGICVCDPLEWNVALEPVSVYLGLQNTKPARVEFRNLSAWSAEGVPTPAERLAKKEVPVKEPLKTSFVWPVDELREGRILAGRDSHWDGGNQVRSARSPLVGWGGLDCIAYIDTRSATHIPTLSQDATATPSSFWTSDGLKSPENRK